VFHFTLLQPTQDNAHEQINTWGRKGEKNFALVFYFLVFSSSLETKGEKLGGMMFCSLVK
jgi:hypothetical protein